MDSDADTVVIHLATPSGDDACGQARGVMIASDRGRDVTCPGCLEYVHA